ncbi:hypothetical protein ACFLXL_00505 [Chloroflexota bacterium]
MFIINGILVGLIAGVFMGCVSQLGYWLGVLRSHLIVIDGKFALRTMKQNISTTAIYVTGTIIHLVTSIIFGIVYILLAKLIGFDPRTIWMISVYVLGLWLAMLVVALPIAGQGFLGSSNHHYVWLEQLILHIIFGIGFWWALGIV